jgi:hypothetical protein
MPSLVEKYFENPTGRTAIFSFLIAAFLFLISWFIPLANVAEDSWYSFLYKDVTLPVEDRFNFGLVIIEVILFTLFFFFVVVFLGSMADLRNTLPSYFEIFTAAVISITLAAFIPKIGVTGGVAGTGTDKGVSHFTPDMQTTVIWLTILGILLMTLYLYFTRPADE